MPVIRAVLVGGVAEGGMEYLRRHAGTTTVPEVTAERSESQVSCIGD